MCGPETDANRFRHVAGERAGAFPPTEAAIDMPPATVALVGFDVEDEAALRRILDCGKCPSAADCKWKIQRAANLDAALKVLGRGPIPLVLCDRDRKPSAWKELLESFAGLDRPPLLVVTSRLADEHLWAEALNLGAYDVLARPFDDAEVVRTMSMAWLSWQGRKAARGMASSAG